MPRSDPAPYRLPLGRARVAAFVQRVGQTLASGRRTLQPEKDI